MSVDAAITTTRLVKDFGKVRAVDAIDLDVSAGARYGFLGPNGSGKTTTVRMLLGLVHATSGEITMLGQPIPRRTGQVLRLVGALIEGPAAYGHLSGRANLRVFDATAAGSSRPTRRARIDDALERVGLARVGRRPVRQYSLGMRQRLGLAAALLRQPTLLVLDEPTNGLDPQGIHEVRELMLEMNRNGTTLFLSSHLLAEVEQVCTHVGILDRGRLVRQARLGELTGPTGRVEVVSRDVDRALTLLDGRVLTRDGLRLVVTAPDAAELNRMLVAAGVRVDELRPEVRTLEQVVLEVTSSGSDRFDGVSDGVSS